MLSRARALPAARSALAGIEFALVLPVMLTLLAGLVDVSLATITGRRLSVAANQVALIASTMAVQTSSLNQLSGQQAWQATTAPFAIFPEWLNPGVTGSFSITLSEVDFTSAGGTLAATTRWSVSNPLGQTALRPCGTLAAAPNGSQPAMATLPAGVFGAASVLVGDVSTVFTPVFSSVFTGRLTMLRSAYISPRVNTGVQLTSAGPGLAMVCPARGS